MNFPTNPTRLIHDPVYDPDNAYPFSDANGKQWTWSETRQRWQPYLAPTEATALRSTGEAGGTKFLREDGDGTCSWQTVANGVTDHGALTGLADDDHTQYALADGSRGTFATAAQGTDERVPTAAGLTSKFVTEKNTLVDGDKIAILDSEASNVPKHGLLSAVWTYIKSKIATSGDTITVNGPLVLSSATRPTSSGTGTPSATSLITLADTRVQSVEDMTNVYVRHQMGWDAGPWQTTGVSPFSSFDGTAFGGGRYIGVTSGGTASASALGGGVRYADGGVTGSGMITLSRVFTMRLKLRGQSTRAGAFFLSVRTNSSFWSSSSIGLYQVPQPTLSWVANSAYVLGDRINVEGIVQIVSTAGTTGATLPPWATAINGTTTDNTVTWRTLGPHTSNKWAMAKVDSGGVITLTDTGVNWVTAESGVVLMLRSDGTNVFASVNQSTEVSVVSSPLNSGSPFIMSRSDAASTEGRVAAVIFTFATTIP